MGRGHGHGHRNRRWWSHSHGRAPDPGVTATGRGMRALGVSFAVLLVTALAQAVLVGITGSVALLADTLHNLTDALTAVPLAVAFVLGRRAATDRFPHGLGKAEDLAGLVVLLVIASSAGLAAWWAVDRLANPRAVEHAAVLAVAGVIGFVGNEWVARYRIRVGREIGSAALVADGLHARTDGFTSLAVVASALCSRAGWERADPVIGLLITAAIVGVLVVSAREVLRRFLDGMDPADLALARKVLAATDGVLEVGEVRLRWSGHDMHAEVELVAGADQTLAEGHEIAHAAEHRLMHALPRLTRAVIHVQPPADHAAAAHDVTQHHRNADGTTGHS